jgi:hypothetical protein
MAACNGDVDGDRQSETTETSAPDPLSGVAEDAEAVCGSYDRQEIARQLGTSTDPIEIAEEYATGYREIVRQDAFEGCLRGLR